MFLTVGTYPLGEPAILSDGHHDLVGKEHNHDFGWDVLDDSACMPGHGRILSGCSIHGRLQRTERRRWEDGGAGRWGRRAAWGNCINYTYLKPPVSPPLLPAPLSSQRAQLQLIPECCP